MFELQSTVFLTSIERRNFNKILIKKGNYSLLLPKVIAVTIVCNGEILSALYLEQHFFTILCSFLSFSQPLIIIYCVIVVMKSEEEQERCDETSNSVRIFAINVDNDAFINESIKPTGARVNPFCPKFVEKNI